MHSEASGFLFININCEEYIFPNKHGWCDIWKAISDMSAVYLSNTCPLVTITIHPNLHLLL